MPISAGNATQTAALRQLWARHRITAFSDQEALDGDGSTKDAITNLGLQYSLLTQYTSFLAVDQVVRNKAAADSPSVNQPSPLPQGVENTALGAEVPSTPEPATWAAIGVTLSLLAMLAHRRRRAALRAHHYTS
jgi:Ca-activated chloride channel family protein